MMAVAVWTTTSVRRPHIDDMVDARACVGTSSPITFRSTTQPKTIRRFGISLFNMDGSIDGRVTTRP